MCLCMRCNLVREALSRISSKPLRPREPICIETAPAAVATAEPFVRLLAASVVATAVEQASTGEQIHDVLERGRHHPHKFADHEKALIYRDFS